MPTKTTPEAAVQHNPLTPAQERVLVQKGTEPPFSGKYVSHHEDGTYRCARCSAPLFSSEAKFDSRSGWPSFDDALAGAVRQIPDPDGQRTEIVCARCGGHLGHVFVGEGFTAKDTRYCVNSLSLEFSQAGESAAGAGTEVAYFAGGCFWGVEHHLEQVTGVLSAVSGYMGGQVDEPDYEQVCSGTTGHAETVKVTFDPRRTSYAALAKLFFEIHDPSQVDRQGPDVGSQYRSAIFYTSAEQRQVAEGLIAKLAERGYQVATKLHPAGRFWPAEDYHQDYYDRTGKAPYCHSRVPRFGD